MRAAKLWEKKKTNYSEPSQNYKIVSDQYWCNKTDYYNGKVRKSSASFTPKQLCQERRSPHTSCIGLFFANQKATALFNFSSLSKCRTLKNWAHDKNRITYNYIIITIYTLFSVKFTMKTWNKNRKRLDFRKSTITECATVLEVTCSAGSKGTFTFNPHRPLGDD